MRSVKRALGTTLVAVSLTLLLACLVMWCRSRAWLIADSARRSDLDYASATRRDFELLSENGILMVALVRQTFHDPAQRDKEFDVSFRGARRVVWDYDSHPADDERDKGITPE